MWSFHTARKRPSRARVYRVVIIGGGAIGLIAAANLVRGGAKVTLLARRNAADLQKYGITIVGRLKHHEVAPGDLHILGSPDDPAMLAAVANADLLVLTTKATEVGNALRPYEALLAARGCPILAMTNGLGVAELIRARVPNPVYGAAIMTGSVRVREAMAEVTAHAGPVKIGGLLGDDVRLLRPMLAAGSFWDMELLGQEEALLAVGAKWLFNLGINPMCAIHQVPIGHFLKNSEDHGLIFQASDEAIRAFEHRHGLRLYASGEAYLREELLPKLWFKTKAQMPSMAIDVAERRETELAFLNGKVIEYAEAAQFSTPANEHIIARLRKVEEERRQALPPDVGL